ncbi:MAG: transcriptional regulator [Planctomycetes bacterium]|nr:transcriptional regulator [Planctomycetota bacterium]
MNYLSRKLVTIVTESALEPMLKRDLERLGAEGYTIIDARGKGHRGSRDGNWGNASTNIRVEVVCESAVAQAIAAHCKKVYSDNYGMILYLRDVQVLQEHEGED